MYISELQKEMEQIKRERIWNDMLKEENRVRENIHVIAHVPVIVVNVVEISPVSNRTRGSIRRSASF